MKTRILTLATLVLGSMPALSAADAGNAAEARLRDTLKATMAQLRTAENDRATLQAAQADADQKIKDLTEQVKVLIKQATADKSAADKSVESLKARLAQESEEVARFKDLLAQALAAHEKAATAAHVSEEKNARLIAEDGVLQRQIAELQAKNRELFKLANEILTRYQKFSLGDALAAKEPFVGTTRTQLENLVQDYQDKIRDQRATP